MMLLVAALSGTYASSTVDDLNERYRSGQPSNDYAKAGIFLRMIDGICNPALPDCDYNIANSPPGIVFAGTVEGSTKKPNLPVSLKNDMFDTPKSKEYGDQIAIFQPWVYAPPPMQFSPYGPAAGYIYFSCAAEKATRCMWPTDGGSDKRNLTCSRKDNNHNVGDLRVMSYDGCMDCVVDENPVLLAVDNPITNHAVGRFDDMPNDRTNTTSLQIELLYNRASNMTFGNVFETSGNLTQMKERKLSSSCDLCKSTFKEVLLSAMNLTNEAALDLMEESFNLNYVFYEVKWYEGPGYYSILDQEDSSSLIQPRNELKEMMEAQATHFGVNREYSADALLLSLSWNEFAIDGDTMHNLESSRDYSSTLNLEGVDENDGTCGAAIKALVLICGEQDDPFYYEKPGTCINLPELYKQHYGTDEAPEVVYMNRKNFTHPFATSCDIEISCGVEKKTETTDADGVANGGEEEDNTSDNTASSAASSLASSGCGYLISSLTLYIVVRVVYLW